MQRAEQSLDILADWGTEHLQRVIAIDSQSDEQSASIPSTPGQRVLSDDLAAFFRALDYEVSQDSFANLLVTIPPNVSHEVPSVAFMVHMDTAQGTQAVSEMEQVPAWSGALIAYPGNEHLQVSAELYPETRVFLGDDVLHGPGLAPIGLDDKLGMCELMTLARVLRANPHIPHGELLLVFRPDEEIGRMAAVEGLAETFVQRGVRYAYTVDGIAPFEINVENFNASCARVRIPATALQGTAEASTRRLTIRINGVKSHGATAKAEGYLNATLIFARAMQELAARSDVHPVGFQSDAEAETNADWTVLCSGDLDAAEAAIMEALRAQCEPHAWRGARAWVTAREEGSSQGDSEGLRHVAQHLQAFLTQPGVQPRLSEESEGREGYSNPYFLSLDEGAWRVDYRLRDFDKAGLAAREEHVRAVAQASGIAPSTVEIVAQYDNMGPTLAPYPELVDWALSALEPLGVAARQYPIRGGTGVDPFVERSIPVANLGTGYFAPESEKELTSRQNIARHSAWLINLVQVIAGAPSSER